MKDKEGQMFNSKWENSIFGSENYSHVFNMHKPVQLD